jgi:CRP/FNR family cyclic AMP-dependent transcriptional regulator
MAACVMPATLPAMTIAASASLTALALRGVERSYRKGAQLITEGDVGDTLFIILSGRLRAYSVGDDDREITYGHYGPGEYVGELGLDGGARSASVEAVEKTRVSVVTRATLNQYLADDPQFAFELMNKLIFRVRALTARTRGLALNDVYGRLVALLDGMAVVQPDGSRLTSDPMTHEQLAKHLGCSRAMVTRLLVSLCRHGSLVQERQHYRLLRPLPPKW